MVAEQCAYIVKPEAEHSGVRGRARRAGTALFKVNVANLTVELMAAVQRVMNHNQIHRYSVVW